MVNRVHPETGRSWERWKDQPTIQRVLREQERTLGLTIVPGRLAEVEGHHVPRQPALTSGERRQAERTGEPAFIELVMAHVVDYRAAKSWRDLEALLAQDGLRLERKGQGLIVTDGVHQVKASRAARDLSLKQLEIHFEQAWRFPFDSTIRGESGVFFRAASGALARRHDRLPQQSALVSSTSNQHCRNPANDSHVQMFMMLDSGHSLHLSLHCNATSAYQITK